MSKHETWRTRMYWKEIGGLLVEEFVAVKATKDKGRRVLDGVIVLNEEKGIHEGNSYDIEGKDVIIIQTKKSRRGMHLLGQAYFSKFLIEKLNPKSIKSVAVYGRDDSIMKDLAKKHNIEVIVIPDLAKSLN